MESETLRYRLLKNIIETQNPYIPVNEIKKSILEFNTTFDISDTQKEELLILLETTT